jgi:hypothetical protein
LQSSGGTSDKRKVDGKLNGSGDKDGRVPELESTFKNVGFL